MHFPNLEETGDLRTLDKLTVFGLLLIILAVSTLQLRTMVRLNDTLFATWRLRPNATDFSPPLENTTMQNCVIIVEMKYVLNQMLKDFPNSVNQLPSC